MKNLRFFINEFIRFANIVQSAFIQQKARAFRCREFASCGNGMVMNYEKRGNIKKAKRRR